MLAGNANPCWKVLCDGILCPVRRLKYTKTSRPTPNEDYLSYISRRMNDDRKSSSSEILSGDWRSSSSSSVNTNNVVTELGTQHEVLEDKLLARNVVNDLRFKKDSCKSNRRIVTKHLNKLDNVQLSKVLRKRVIYADKELVVFNKPCGVTAHDETGVYGKANMRSCLPVLSKMIFGLNTSIPLILCNRLDKGTSGVVVCATNKDLSRDVMTLFRQQKVRKKYWGVCVGLPTPREGFIDIPLAERHIESVLNMKAHTRMTLCPKQRLDQETGKIVKASHRSSTTATTYYRVMDANQGLAFVEFQPVSSAKHQIRVHASEALGCPLLGDHKYSNPQKLLPQRLPKTLLKLFNMKATRTRDLGMHLHLKEIIIPGILENASKPNLLVTAKASEHMFKTLKLFNLKPGQQTDFKGPLPVTRNSKIAGASMQELFHDPFESTTVDTDNVQRSDCVTIYKPKIRVKFRS